MRTAQTAAAASRAAGRILKTIAVVGAIATVIEFAREVAGIWGKDGNGDNVVIVPDRSVCSVSPCYEYLVETQPWFKSGPAAAAYFIEQRNISGAPYKDVYRLLSADNTKLTYSWMRDGQVLHASVDQGYATRLIAAQPPVNKTLTQTELEEALANSPSLPQILDDLDRQGTPIPFDEPEVEVMPQPVVLPPSVTTHPDGSTTTTQTTYIPYLMPDGKTIGWKKTDVVTQTSKPDINGDKTTSTTKTETDQGPPLPEKEEAPAVDTPLPGLPKLYDPKYPDGLVGVWNTQKEAFKNTPLPQLARKLMPEVPMGGNCPTMYVDLSFSSWANFGSRDLAPPCYVWDWAKVIVILGALIAARALIFGG